jgi:hypothetical protein
MHPKTNKCVIPADECREEVAMVLDSRERERYLKMAEYWLKMVKAMNGVSEGPRPKLRLMAR